MKDLGAFLAHLLLLAFGVAMVLSAGRLEAEGRLVEAKRTARRGGWMAAVGAPVGAVGAATLPAYGAFVAIALLVSGFAAWLAGLSGKPRPTGWAAAVLLFVGVVVAIASVR
ncbi:MAG TPA: hypothetical protein VFV19_19195 [Candidatus Polarisedimenticolaceae bacterium]|nr:hypothetical protein [Candidatus Polarisedimenticolaceae bacterium]